MEAYKIKAMAKAIQLPLFRQKIYTTHMKPYSRELQFVIGPSAITFYISLARVNDIKKALKLQESIQMSIARTMDLRGGEELPVRLYAQGGFLTVGVARQDPWLPSWQDVQKSKDEWFFVGYDEFNEPAYLDLFGVSDPGLLIIGASGSGKTNAMRVLARQAIDKGIGFYLVDLKGGRSWKADLAQYAIQTAWDEEQARHVTQTVFNEIQRRNQSNDYFEPLLFIFDEITEADEELQRLLGRAAKLCRSANIRILGGTQRAGDELNKEVKGNMPRRLIGRVIPSDAYNATNQKGSGAQHLRGGGDMLIAHQYGLKRVQVPKGDPSDFRLAKLPKKTEPKPVPLEPKKKEERPKILTTDERAYLLAVLPIESRKALFKWLPAAINSMNQIIEKKGGKKIPAHLLAKSARCALETGKPTTIKKIKSWLKYNESVRTDRIRQARYFGGVVVGDQRSIEEISKLWGVPVPRAQ